MLETATTEELQQAYQSAHALRAAAFRDVFGGALRLLARALRGVGRKNGPHAKRRPVGTVSACA